MNVFDIVFKTHYSSIKIQIQTFKHNLIVIIFMDSLCFSYCLYKGSISFNVILELQYDHQVMKVDHQSLPYDGIDKQVVKIV